MTPRTRSAAPAGLRPETLVPWLAAHVPGLRAPLRFDLIAGGMSNLTYRVEDAAGTAYVLRRPPLGAVLSTAHDVRREHRILAALAASAVPVPPVVAVCADDAVTGAPFFVMRFVEGEILRTADGADPAAVAVRQRVGRELVDVLVEIHRTDVDAIGLGDLARRDGYLGRQLARWHRQYALSSHVRVPLIDALYALLAERMPAQAEATLVHGDHRLENCLVGPGGDVRAVLDWELATLGDPLADLGLFLAYWRPPADLTCLPQTTRAEGFDTREEIVARYRDRTGRTVSRIGYYIAFGYWKLACILSGVHARHVAGDMGPDAVDVTNLPRQIELLAEAAADALATEVAVADHGGGDPR